MASRDNENIIAEPDPEPGSQVDDGSAVEMSTSSLSSLRSSVLQYQMENGRTYHSVSSGKYAYPNDDAENERLDLQHNIWLLTFRGALGLCPKTENGARRVLDAGTGTGIWAIEYADAHPESEVIGIDLSPIQPVPPNCSFEVDDLEKDWAWIKPFDLIFARVIAGSLTDYQAFINKAFAALEPGGYLELQDLHMPYQSDDGTLKEGSGLDKLGHLFIEASAKIGRSITVAAEYKSLMEKAGFVDIVEKRYKWPIGTWPRDQYYKELGKWMCVNLDTGLEGLTMALATRVLSWTPEATGAFCADVKKGLRDPTIHAYLPIYVVYGKKPEVSAK
ncbi:TAM domain methyltransferase [Thozetella sp. PMI_491]|nr:TAM domain methyltransferase [Thozetella sp. PMI_491]